MAGRSPRSTWRRALRVALLSLSLLWAAIWVLGGIGSALDPQYDQTLASGLGVAFGVGVLPCVPVWIYLRRRARPTAPGTSRRQAMNARAERAAAERAAAEAVRARQDDIARLPEQLREEWTRMEEASALVGELADRGWIERAALLELHGHVTRLRRIAEIDARTDRLGGRTSPMVLQQVTELRELMVALADAAVDHQATLAGGSHVPTTLADARQYLDAATAAYRSFDDPAAGPLPG